MRRMLALLTCLTALTLCHGTARADVMGAIGSLIALEVNTGSADTFLQYHGRMFVDANGTLGQYRWGGTSCGSRVLDESEVALLQRALNQKKMTIQPRYQDGQGQTQCLVGFVLVEKKNLKLLP